MNSFLELFTTEAGDIHMTEKQLVYFITKFGDICDNKPQPKPQQPKKQQPKRSPVADIWDNQFDYVELEGFTLHKQTYSKGDYKVSKGYRFTTLEEAVKKFNDNKKQLIPPDDVFGSIQIIQKRNTIYYELRATDILNPNNDAWITKKDFGVYIPCSNKKEVVEEEEEVVEEEVVEEVQEEVEEVVAIPQEEEEEEDEVVHIIEIGDDIHGYIEDSLEVWNVNTSEIVGKYDIEAQKIIFN